MAKPFGWAIQATGDLGPDTVERIPDALRRMESVCIARIGREEQQNACDSDNDGMSDVKELRECRDPNLSGAGVHPTYGCGARVVPGASHVDGSALAIALVAAATLVAGARRSRRSR